MKKGTRVDEENSSNPDANNGFVYLAHYLIVMLLL